eukprot:8367078-Pyramimonas_sp.AAC.1
MPDAKPSARCETLCQMRGPQARGAASHGKDALAPCCSHVQNMYVARMRGEPCREARHVTRLCCGHAAALLDDAAIRARSRRRVSSRNPSSHPHYLTRRRYRGVASRGWRGRPGRPACLSADFVLEAKSRDAKVPGIFNSA